MTAKYSKIFMIKKSEFVNGKVKKHTYKDIIEYWIYAGSESDIIDTTGKKFELDNWELKYVIACAGDYITKEDSEHLIVEGVRFSNDTIGNHLDEYLRKTGRGRNG